MSYGHYVPKFHYHPWETCRTYRDVRDNIHDVGTIAAPTYSALSAVQSEYAGTGISQAPVSIADSMGVNVLSQITSTQTTTLTDPGIVAGLTKITKDALDTGSENVIAASKTILEAFRINTELAKQAQAGPVGMIGKILGWVAVAALALWAATKIFGGRKSGQ